jgi:hypothetical protein
MVAICGHYGRISNYGNTLVPQKQPGISMSDPRHNDMDSHRDG